MTSSISGAASTNTSTGLGQGIDIQQFVQLALSGDNAHISNLQTSQSIFSAQSTALSKITADLTALQLAAFSLNDPLGSLNSQTANSSNTSVLSATAATSAIAATHSITVNSLATTSSYYTDPVATSATPISTGSFQIQVGSGTPATITVDSTNNTLDGLVSAINSQAVGVRASVINDANGARLALASETTGAPGDIAVSANTTGLNFNKAVQGLNASLVVDGIPISSTTNSVSSAINGVTLNLSSPSPNSPVTLTVASDGTKASAALQQFVTAYNTAITDINSQFAVKPDGTGGGPLEADGSLREAQNALLGAVAYSSSGSNGIVNLSSLGVNLNNDGTLTLDSSALTSTLSSHFSDVQNFLQTASAGFAANLNAVVTQLIDPGSGTLGLDAKGIAQSSQDLGQHIADLQASLAIRQQQLTQVYSQVNATLQELPLLQSQISQQLGSIR
jgi:flagellar hook-associated protein 2